MLLWPDTFTNFFHPHIDQAAIELVEDAGWRVTIPTEPGAVAWLAISDSNADTSMSAKRAPNASCYHGYAKPTTTP